VKPNAVTKFAISIYNKQILNWYYIRRRGLQGENISMRTAIIIQINFTEHQFGRVNLAENFVGYYGRDQNVSETT